MERKKYLDLFLTFLKIGAFTFGGGYAMIPLIQRETVDNHGWINNDDVLEIVAIAESTPGPVAINSATFVGHKIGGFWGAVSATTGVVLPSFVIILVVAGCLDRFRKSRVVQGCMSGLRPAVIGLIGAAAVTTGKTVFFPAGISLTGLSTPAFYSAAVIFLLMLLPALKKVHPILIIVASAVLGITAGFLINIL